MPVIRFFRLDQALGGTAILFSGFIGL